MRQHYTNERLRKKYCNDYLYNKKPILYLNYDKVLFLCKFSHQITLCVITTKQTFSRYLKYEVGKEKQMFGINVAYYEQLNKFRIINHSCFFHPEDKQHKHIA